MKQRWVLIAIGLWITSVFAASDGGITLLKANIDLNNKASLERGAQTYMTYCQACHSLQYMRYNNLGIMLGYPEEREALIAKLRASRLLPKDAKPNDRILSPLTKEQGLKTYGVVPPDLSLKAREKGVDWLFTYLLSFYQDASRPSGVNNLLMPNTAMPNMLGPLQGVQEPRCFIKKQEVDGKKQEIKEISGLKLVKLGSMSPQEFDEVVNDLVNFLDYTSEPIKQTRQKIGVWVVLFLIIFAIITYFLKRAFWEDIH